MKLISLSFCDSAREWSFENITFFDLTLLVGVSGVGKTQILRAIRRLKSIAEGASLNGIKWNMEFQTINGWIYFWEGEFENLQEKGDGLFEDVSWLENDEERVKPRLLSESLKKNDEVIVKRDQNNFLFQGKEMPKLSVHESVISILKEEGAIKPAYDGFKKIILRDHTEKEGIRFRPTRLKKLAGKYDNLKSLKESDLNTLYKLALVKQVDQSIFDQIKDSFMDVFPQVEDLKVEPFKDEIPFYLEAPVIQIKEKGVNKWIPHSRMSSGMLRTLTHIAEMYLWSDGTVVLIDEFENSLGVNCIHVLTEDLLIENKSIQFIATSHHPYIINKIPYEYWKIVTRSGGKIQTHDAKDFNLGESHHERFMSLINHPFFKKGISA